MAVAFGRVLRGAGLKVPLGSVLTFVSALGRLHLDDRSQVYWAGRATLVRNPEDIPLYDRSFEVFWGSLRTLDDTEPEPPMTITLAVDDDGDEGDSDKGDSEAADEPQITLRFSAMEVLRHKDFASYDADELRTGGEPMHRMWREPGERLRRLVLLVDVSGSMEPYARALLRFVHAAVSGRQRVEAFSIGTRLTRVTRELDSRDPDKALAQASTRVQDWSGGTRLGDCLRRFNDQWGVRGMARGAIVVILSDGWDRGDPEVLAEEMRRLQRISYHVIWVNPLKVTPGYAPLARGMAAALPYVDHFVEGHSLDAMHRLASVIAMPSPRGGGK